MNSAESTQKRLGNIFFYGLAILVAYFVYLVLSPFLVSLAWAAVLVVVTYPVHERILRRWRPNSAALISTVAVTLILIVPTILVLIAFARQAVGAVESIHLRLGESPYAWSDRFWERLQLRFPEFAQTDVGGIIHRYAEQGAAYIAARFGAILRNTAEFIFDMAFTILGMFFFFRDGHTLANRLRRSLPLEEAQQDRIMDETHGLIFATVTSSLAAAGVHGVLGAIAFAITGVKGPLFWGTLMGFFSFIPVIGTAFIWVPLSLSLMFTGHLAAGLILVAICSVGLGMVDNVVRPLLIRGRAEMNTLLIFIGVLGGVHVFGLLGVVLGPIVIAAGVTLLDFYTLASRSGKDAAEPSGQAKDVVLE